MTRTTTEPIHLRPAAELAERVLLPGDPHRALAVAQAVLEEPRMFNHHRGLWGYTGRARDGEPMTVQATGMGGPSAAIVVHELLELGARTLVRIGTCGALDPALRHGDLLVVEAALAEDGASLALGAEERVLPDPDLTAALAAAADERTGPVVTSDLFYDPRPGMLERWRGQGAVAVEMEAATVLQAAAAAGRPAGCVLAVTDELGPGGERRRIDREGLEAAGLRVGEAAAAALVTPR